MINKVLYTPINNNVNDSLMYSYYSNFITDNEELIDEYEKFELNQINKRLKIIDKLQKENNIKINTNKIISGISCINDNMVMIIDIE